MSVLVYLENVDGKFKKSTFELVSFASAIAQKMNFPLVAISIGTVSDEELNKAGKYGASKVLNASGDQVNVMNTQAYASVIAQAAKSESSKVLSVRLLFLRKLQ